MPKRLNRHEQLRLELSWDYLKWVVAASESFDLYEVTTRILFGKAVGKAADGTLGNDVNPF